MNESLDRSFGILIAYILPGFFCLAGASQSSATIAAWMSVAPSSDPTVGGFLYVTLGSLAAGMVINAFRWLLIDSLHHLTGLSRPNLDFSKLSSNLEAFKIAVEHNYRHYQFYANTVIAGIFYSLADQWANGHWPLLGLLAGIVVEGVLLVTSRDCLRRYYERTAQLIGHDGFEIL